AARSPLVPYTTLFRSSLISLAGPLAGGLAAAVVWAIGSERDSSMLVVLANLGFLLNVFNLLPIGFLDGGSVARSIGEAWRMPVRSEEHTSELQSRSDL